MPTKREAKKPELLDFTGRNLGPSVCFQQLPDTGSEVFEMRKTSGYSLVLG
jgi:hypothetical protein